jgi:hypothetical protein
MGVAGAAGLPQQLAQRQIRQVDAPALVVPEALHVQPGKAQPAASSRIAPNTNRSRPLM